MDNLLQDEDFMLIALNEAKKAAEKGEVPVGAVIVKNGEVIAKAHNTRESEKNALHHAEILAIDLACKKLGGWRLWECELFVTLEPCPMCTGAIINSRIKRVVFGAKDEKSGCCGSVANFFEVPFNHKPQIVSDVLKDECTELLQVFFANLREKFKNGEKSKWKKPL